MLVGLIGAGRIGGTLARLLVGSGHEVVLANRRGPLSLTAQVRSLGPAASAGDVAQAAGTADLVVLAMPFGAYVGLRPDPFAGIVVVDATNYFADRDGHLPTLATGRSTSSEIIAAHLPGARVVKAFNTMPYATLGSRGRPTGTPDRLVIPVAGESPSAVATVGDLIDGLGFDWIASGDLRRGGRLQQPGGPLFNAVLNRAQAANVISTARPG
jgi:predicted dinucleotide-binding enzyme